MAKEIKWSDEQIKAIDHRNGAAIVSAAAGSGKTAVLVERVKRLFLNTEDPVYADETVITTFTKKAASEMRSRLEAALEDALGAAEQDDTALRKLITEQQRRLKDAYICTTDSLCMNILRRYSAEAGLRPDFKVLDESQTKLLAGQAMKTVLDGFCEAEDSVTAAKRDMLYERFAGEDDSRLEETVRYLHEFSKKIPDAQRFFERQLAAFSDPAAITGLMKERIDEELQSSVILPLKEIQRLTDELCAMTADTPAAGTGETWLMLAGMYGKAEWGSDDFREKLKAADDAFLAAKAAKATDCTTTSKKVNVQEVKSCITKLKEICATLPGNSDKILKIGTENRQCAPVLEALLELVGKYDSEFSRLKSELGGLDFDDMELKTLSLLGDGNGGQSAVAKAIAAEMRIIIVDEFQDSNEVQYELYRLMSRDLTNLYLVGDIKQSIYRFRGADPLVFQRLTKNGSGFEVLRLNKNFRSCKQVVDSVNAIFEGTMTVEKGDVDYNDECRLVQGASYPTTDSANGTEFIEIHARDSKEAREREAGYIAQRIRKMIAEGFPVSDGNGGTRPCQYGDFAVIMGSYTNFAAIYKKALDDADIPFEAKDESDYTDLEEVKYMLSLLRVIDDPYRDADLAAVLMKEPYLFSAAEVAEMKLYEKGSLKYGLEKLARLNGEFSALDKAVRERSGGEIPENDAAVGNVIKDISPDIYSNRLDTIYQSGRQKRSDLWSGLVAAAKKGGRAANALRDIESWREYAAENSPARLIRKICDESMIVPAFEAGRGGLKKGLNLRMLAHYAENFPGSESAGLYDFLQYLDTLGKKKIKLTKAEGDGSSRDAVQIMTIHSSKGLEFPICFLVNLKSTNRSIHRADGIICDARYGIGMTIVDAEKRLRINTYFYNTVAQEYGRLEMSESMRLLYVALTRAKEKLIITVPLSGKKPQKDTHHSWITESGAVTDGLIIPVCDPMYDEIPSAPAPDVSPSVGISLFTGYKYRRYSEVPAKFTATQIGVDSDFEHEGRADDDTRVLRVPSFLKSGDASKLTGKRRGDAYHKALELIDLSTPAESVSAELDRFCERGSISLTERNSINDDDIVTFLNSDICRRAAACGKESIFKEYPLFYEPDDAELSNICRKYGIDANGWDYDERPVIQGITDMFFIEAGGIVLVDYKTNSHVTEEDLIREYRGQLAVYAHALTESMGMTVKERVLYSFWLGKSITVG